MLLAPVRSNINSEALPSSSSGKESIGGPSSGLGSEASLSVGSERVNLCVQQIIKASVLMAVSNWSPVSSSTAITTKDMTTKTAKEPTQSEAIVPKHNRIDSFKCDQCGRCIPFRYLSSSTAMNPLNQHRSFCLWASNDNDLATQIEGSSSSIPGWLQCARAVMNDKEDGYSGLGFSGADLGESSVSRYKCIYMNIVYVYIFICMYIYVFIYV
jgi:hypothetical protein